MTGFDPLPELAGSKTPRNDETMDAKAEVRTRENHSDPERVVRNGPGT